MTESWLSIFPERIRSLLIKLPAKMLTELEEVRIREERPLEINAGGRFYFLKEDGALTDQVADAVRTGREESHRLLDLITNHSVYTMEEELRKGFITLPGGHRMGLSGRTVLSRGKVEHIRDISGFNLRIAREVKGASSGVLPHLLDYRHKSVLHTLIVAPPQQGKTTMLRDIARAVSSGQFAPAREKWPGLKVAIIDERSEIAGCRRGVPSFDIGPRTDIMDGCPKAEGIMMMIRSMSPDVIIVDEIGRPEDAEALTQALHAGVRVIATAHGSGINGTSLSPLLSGVSVGKLFQRFVALGRGEHGFTFKVYDGEYKPLI
ncbi:stage III sporulation protein AA [Paenibacillus yonginensis]|uniref:Stage III sporulation protein AA n=1 Tax=Paenibacillus yonginensis TaxID=1462996 RepID=A0A1B1N0J6_9BACL|nr:stage III sporulation protein AA [Paenibacillus yonginensis]ANS74942.1 stage III sporulation protein AA [Paenibacillus yonginensis]